MQTLPSILYPIAATTSLLMAGVYFAFSISVMKALAQRPEREGIAAMQAINSVILNAVFLSLFLGAALCSLAATVLASVHWEWPRSGLALGGGIAYILGSFVVTIACNVPMNDRLAALNPEDSLAAEYWGRYIRRWTAWNHLRCITSALGGVLMLFASRW